MSSNDFRLFLLTMVEIFDGVFELLTEFTIAGIPFLYLLLGFLALLIFVKVIRHISIGGGEE